MHIATLSDYPAGAEISADICIVGSGPAGATIALELAGTGLRVLVLESGKDHSSDTANALNVIENVGAPREMDQSLVRPRILGGASSLWSGRCAPFNEVDYHPRAWVPYSGWPITPSEITQYMARSGKHLGLGAGENFGDRGPPVRRKARPHAIGLDRTILRPFFWQFSRDTANRHDFMRFGPRLVAKPLPGVRVIIDATVVSIGTNSTASAVRSLEVAQSDGTRRSIIAPCVVLCAGGIENARLLLSSHSVAKAGLGNGHDRVGRFLMDHLRGGIAKFDHTRASELSPYLGTEMHRVGSGRFLFSKGLRLSPGVQEREQLLNCAVWLSEFVGEDDPFSALKRILRNGGNRPRELKTILINPGLFARGLKQAAIGGMIPRKLEGLELNCIVEQRPDPDSRVMLSSRLDRFGVPLSRVEWRVNEQERHTIRRTALLVAREFARIGLPVPEPEDWVKASETPPASFRDVAHHIGTTRMSLHPADGVVDTECQVHGVQGLYVGGSSVFPTGGHANPTLMIVAMAIRLADRLRQHYRLALAA